MFERLAIVRRNARDRVDLKRLVDDCRQILGVRGEANSVAIAAMAIERCGRLSADGMHQFFQALAEEFNPDPGEVLALAERYAVSRSPENLIRLSQAAEAPRQELFRRLNRAPGATAVLINLRARLLERLRQDKKLVAVDADLEHLLSSWFNPGFLQMIQVDWRSPAALLERIIHHEAVHAIDGWNDLRRRLEPDRRCFAFFHPALPDEPLIFVEVALMPSMPNAIAPLLDRAAESVLSPDKYRVAVFYSISNCQPGLRGINLGNFLIKRVAEHLTREFPKLKAFCTLSPIPSLAGWLAKLDTIGDPALKLSQSKKLNDSLKVLRQKHGHDLASLGAGDVMPERELDALMRLAAYYLAFRSGAVELTGSADPVARFHLHNGARLERINPQADLSRKGLKQSFGLMVNYLYDLEEIESNHERFAHGEVNASKSVHALI
jgi:malonyl-CoA decarboxylase